MPSACIHILNLIMIQYFTNHCLQNDAVAEWLRRWTANPMGSARVGSNPIGVEIYFAMKRC